MSNGYSARFPLGQYPARFHREAAPLWLSAVVAARGVAPPARGTWCDVGCGQGIDTLIFAATNPDMQFWGIDVDPDHIATARNIAASAGISNAHFICADVRDQAALADLPAGFDFMIQHGIYSWVSDDIRAALHHFAATRVAKGGVVLVHYMAQPGAAVFLALQNMLLSLEGTGRDIADRIDTLRAMADAGAGFFVQYPHAVALLDRLAQDDPALVAHEYLGVESRAFSACEMIAAFANAGLSYIGSANPIENYDTVSLPAKTRPVIAAEPLPALRETLRDVARNQHTRYDIYQNAPRKLTVEARWEAMRDQRYLALPGLPEPGGVTFRSPVGPVDGGVDIFQPLLSCFADGQADFARMVQSLDGQAGVAEQAVMMLMGAGALHPMRSDGTVAPSADRLTDVLRNAQRSGLDIDQRIGTAYPSNTVTTAPDGSAPVSAVDA